MVIAMRRAALSLLLLSLTASAPDERSFMLTEFDRIRVDGPFEVRVITTGPAGARASGDGRAIERVRLRVDGQTLVVTTDTRGFEGYGRDRNNPPVITVRAQRLRAALVNGAGSLTIAAMRSQRVDLGVNGGGRIDARGIETDQLHAVLTGTGAIAASGRALRARFASNGAGGIDASGLSVNDLTVVSQSAGNGRFAARNTADVTALGIGSVTVEGTPTCRTRGPGPVRCGAARP